MAKRLRSLEPVLSRLEKIWLYETSTYYYLVGCDELEIAFRLLKINRVIEKPKNLSDIVYEDQLVYSQDEITDILGMIHDGNKTSGGMVKVCTACGLVGFVKFLDCFYFTLVTQKREVGCIGGNFIYSIKATEIFAVRRRDEQNNNAFTKFWKKLNKKINQTSAEIAESRYMGLFQFVDMTKDFFFSYTYDLTHSLQHNHITSCGRNTDSKIPEAQEIFAWNHYQTNELRDIVKDGGSSQWVLPMIHGSYQQKRFSLFGKSIDMVVMARRSRHYAGTRYLKRGISVHGKVANDCEVEQMMQYEEGGQTQYCSYVQMRGSIPTYWYQETSVTMPKPPILLNRMDPDYLATELHFSDLISRYSTPIIVLDLVKQHEKKPRESLVGKEFRQAVEVLNESIETEHKIRYIALDYSKITSISKGKHKGKEGVSGKTPTNNKEAAKPGSAVGTEWAMMESSLSNKAGQSGGSAVPASHDKRQINSNSGSNSANTSEKLPGTPPHKAFGSNDSLNLLSDQQTSSKDTFNAPNSPSPANVPTDNAGIAMGGNHGNSSSSDAKLDVLRELEDIAILTISETQFFCSSLNYLDKIKLVTPKYRTQAEQLGYTQQSGVLRTNCIDCLDRTNGGQFAVAMKFLAVSLQALGICSIQQAIEPNSQLLLALMDMFGEMGDKIAMQYGGSEAHKKVLAGKGGQKPGAPKQNELLTSIKRYYSNAFTDMVKQDAMNVFLGCYVPSEESVPLWDLESDFNLHNKTLRPPDPPVCKVLFDEIVSDNRKLRSAKARNMIESTVRSIILKEKDRVISDAEGAALLTGAVAAGGAAGLGDSPTNTGTSPTGDYTTEGITTTDLDAATDLTADLSTEAGTPTTEVNSASSSFQAPPLLPSTSGDLSEDLVASIKAIDLPSVELKTVTNRYFIRNISFARSSITEGHTPRGRPAKTGAGRNKGASAVSNIIRSIARLEKRKLTRKIASAKILRATEKWWLDALEKYNVCLHGAATGPVPTIGIRKTRSSDALKRASSSSNRDQLPTQSYFHRVYRPEELTEFDTLFSLEFVSPIDSSSSSTLSGSFKKSIDALAESTGGDEEKNPDGTAAPAAPSSTSYFFLPSILTSSSSNHAAPTTTAASAPIVTSSNSSHGGIPVPLTRTNRSDSLRPAADETGEDGGGFAIARYVRDLGMKARTLVGGFLRKEDSQVVTTTPSGGSKKRGGHHVEWNWRQQQINYHQHRVPKTSSLLYSKYVAIANDNLILMDGNKHVMRLAEEEYYNLLHDYSISMDNVAGMEHLAIESHVSSEVNQGVYRGMRQSDSAYMSYGFLFAAVVNVEAELQTCRVHVDTEASFAGLGVNGRDNNAILRERQRQHQQSMGRTINSNSKTGKMSMELTPATQERIYKVMKHAQVASGLESEFKRLVSNYIFQQYSYSKDIAGDRLAKRMSTLSSERSIIEYTMLFDQDTLCSSFDTMSYLTSDSPAYQTFADLDSLRQSLSGLESTIAAKKKELVQQAEMQWESDRKKDEKNKSETSENNNNSSGCNDASNRAVTLSDPLLQEDGRSISQLLGIEYSGMNDLHSSLETDYTLENVFTHYPYNSSSTPTVFGREHEHAGFSLQATDLYSRTTNTHLSMNEICVTRFNDALAYR